MISNTRRANNNRDLSSESRVLPMAMARGICWSHVYLTEASLSTKDETTWFCKGVQENAACVFTVTMRKRMPSISNFSMG